MSERAVFVENLPVASGMPKDIIKVVEIREVYIKHQKKINLSYFLAMSRD